MALVDVFDPISLGITPAEILSVFSWGLSTVLLLYFLGYAIGAGVAVIRKA
jgi:Ni/Fe-hydrogenase subunit HybB-like protein